MRKLLTVAFVAGLAVGPPGCTASTTKVRVRVTTTPVAAFGEADVVVEVRPAGAAEPAARLVVRLPRSD